MVSLSRSGNRNKAIAHTQRKVIKIVKIKPGLRNKFKIIELSQAPEPTEKKT